MMVPQTDHENFDQDELDHEQEQFYETNPYKKDDLSILRGNGGMV